MRSRVLGPSEGVITVLPVLGAIGAGIGGAFSGLGGIAGSVVGSLGGVARGALSGLGAGLLEGGAFLSSSLLGGLELAGGALLSGVEAVPGLLSGAGELAWSGVEAVPGLLSGAGELVVSGVEALPGIITGTGEVLGTFGRTLAALAPVIGSQCRLCQALSGSGPQGTAQRSGAGVVAAQAAGAGVPVAGVVPYYTATAPSSAEAVTTGARFGLGSAPVLVLVVAGVALLLLR